MLASEFLALLSKAVDGPSTYYTGGFGQDITIPANLEAGLGMYAKNRQYETLLRSRAEEARAAGRPCWGYDCVNLIKGILLWGWTGKAGEAYGGAKYDPATDWTVNMLWSKCADRSEDFTGELLPGEMLYYGNGSHCGVYIGEGKAIEATAAWGRVVTVSTVSNVTADANIAERPRTWQAHGKLPGLVYDTRALVELEIPEDALRCPCCGAQLRLTVGQIRTDTDNFTAAVKLEPAGVLGVHTVRDGESPWTIAVEWYGDGTKYPLILEYNNITPPGIIYGGQQLIIPRG